MSLCHVEVFLPEDFWDVWPTPANCLGLVCGSKTLRYNHTVSPLAARRVHLPELLGSKTNNLSEVVTVVPVICLDTHDPGIYCRMIVVSLRAIEGYFASSRLTTDDNLFSEFWEIVWLIELFQASMIVRQWCERERWSAIIRLIHI